MIKLRNKTGLVDLSERSGLPYGWLWYRLNSRQITLPVTAEETEILKQEYNDRKKQRDENRLKAGAK